MRFKSRMFPLIDVMILLLGLFLVILAQAQLTVQPEQEPTRLQPPERERDHVSAVLVWDYDKHVAISDPDARRVSSPNDLLALVSWDVGDDFAVVVRVYRHRARPSSFQDLMEQFESHPQIETEEVQVERVRVQRRLETIQGTWDEDD